MKLSDYIAAIEATGKVAVSEDDMPEVIVEFAERVQHAVGEFNDGVSDEMLNRFGVYAGITRALVERGVVEAPNALYGLIALIWLESHD